MKVVFVWVVVVYNFLHQPQASLPTQYPSASACNLAVLNKTAGVPDPLPLGYWTNCEQQSIIVPAAPASARHRR